MPAISDPGYRLIRTCIERDLEVEVLPGPSAVTTALVASGLPADRWRFEGFLPRRAGELERVLRSAETVVAFESPRRLPDSLAALAALAPNRPAAVCRELTKLHEEVARGTLGELARRFRDEVKGEIVVVVAPAASSASASPTSPSPSMRCDAWSSPAPGRGPRQRWSPPSPAPGQRPLPRAHRPGAARVGNDGWAGMGTPRTVLDACAAGARGNRIPCEEKTSCRGVLPRPGRRGRLPRDEQDGRVVSQKEGAHAAPDR